MVELIPNGERIPRPRARHRASGFTLFEVLVALAVIAVAMAAVSRATLMATDATTDLRNRQLALWVAENRLAWHRATKSFPPFGVTNGIEVQAGIPFVWIEETKPTPNATIRRLEVSVAIPGQEGFALTRQTGFLASE